jgi:hypothetical protein
MRSRNGFTEELPPLILYALRTSQRIAGGGLGYLANSRYLRLIVGMIGAAAYEELYPVFLVGTFGFS